MEAMECNICMERLDSTERRPKSLPCGHTVCLHCLRRIGKQACPQCRQEFAEPVEALLDNFFVLNFMEKESPKSSNHRFWCQDCAKTATEDCMDRAHSICSLRKLRSEQAAPRLQRLQGAATAAREVVQALRDAKKQLEAQLDAQLDEWRAKLQQIEEDEQKLQLAVKDGKDFQADQPDGLEQLQNLQDAASLLHARCTLQLRSKDGTEWEGGLQQGGSRSLLNPLVLHLHRHACIAKIGKTESAAAEGVFAADDYRDVLKYSTQDEHSPELDDVLQDPDLAKVKKLNGVNCEKRPNWCKVLLQRVAPHLEWLHIGEALREHLDVIHDMPALRFLHVHLADYDADAPDLPLQLEELEVLNVLEQHLQSVQRMPNLRKLTLNWNDEPVDVAFPPLPPHHRGLQRLQVFLRPASTVLSLAKAHAATLQELRILCASEGDTPWHFKDLADGLWRCGLVALRRVVLMRAPAPDFPDNKLPHGQESCRRQKNAVWDSLLAADSKAVRVVTVLCGECDKCPVYPELGNFTWIDS